MIRWEKIPLASVDLNSPFYPCEANDAELKPLIVSLGDVGLLNPPWVRPQPDGRWQLVTGRKRFQAAAALKWPEIPARVLPPDTPEVHCLLLHLYDNAFSRGFSLPEQAHLAAELLKYRDRREAAAKFLPYLGLPPSPALLDRLLKLAQLDAPWQQLAAQGRLALSAAAALAAWSPEYRTAALPFFQNLHLSQSKQEEFLEQVGLLARREGVSHGAILAREELTAPLAAASLSAPEKAAAVRRQLRRWVYPRFSAAAEAFQEALARLGWKGLNRVQLHPPPAFEGPDFRLEIKFRDAPELQQLLQEIARLAQEEEFSALTSR